MLGYPKIDQSDSDTPKINKLNLSNLKTKGNKCKDT